MGTCRCKQRQPGGPFSTMRLAFPPSDQSFFGSQIRFDRAPRQLPLAAEPAGVHLSRNWRPSNRPPHAKHPPSFLRRLLASLPSCLAGRSLSLIPTSTEPQKLIDGCLLLTGQLPRGPARVGLF